MVIQFLETIGFEATFFHIHVPEFGISTFLTVDETEEGSAREKEEEGVTDVVGDNVLFLFEPF